MKDFFIWLYELLHGVQENQLWDDVYQYSGIICLILIPVVFCFVYYHILNRFFINWFKPNRWFLIMFINSLFAAVISTIIVHHILEPVDFLLEFIYFGFINFIYSALFYAIFSLIFCWSSPHAKYTPYKFLTNYK